MQRFNNVMIVLFLLVAAIAHAQEGVDPVVDDGNRSIGLWKYPSSGSGASKLLPDISVIGTLAGAYFSQDPVGETGHDPARTGFTLQEIELALQSVIDPYLRADVFVAFHEDEVELEEGFATTLADLKGFQLRAGKFLLPLGRENRKHLEQCDFADTMLVNKYFLGPENLNELGLEISYLFPTPFFLELQGTVSNGDNEASFGGTRKEDLLYQGRLTSSVDLPSDITLLFGASAAAGFNDTDLGNATHLYGGDFLFKWKGKHHRAVTWQTEYLYRRMEVPGALQTDGGLYSYIDYRFLRRWHLGLRSDAMGLPAAAIAKEWRLAPALTFNPTEFSRLRLQYNYDKVNTIDPVHAVVLQLQFNMGPHGAHPF